MPTFWAPIHNRSLLVQIICIHLTSEGFKV